MDRNLQKKKSEAQLEKEKQIKINNGIIKYIFIDPASLKTIKIQKLSKYKEITNKDKVHNITVDQKLSKKQILPKPPKTEKRSNTNQRRLKKVNQRRKVTKFRKKKIPNSLKFSKKKRQRKELPQK